jgi:hypothetical protein
MKEPDDHARMEEEFSPESVSREEIIRFLASFPPSQSLDEDQRNRLELLLCEVVANLNPRASRRSVRVTCLFEGERLASVTLASKGEHLLPQSGGRAAAKDTIEEIADFTREDMAHYVLETVFGKGEVEIGPERDMVTMHFLR